MKRTLHVGLLAGVLALCLAKDATPIVGTWEGMQGAAKSATIVVRETEGKIGGSAIFYIVHDEGSGAHTSEETPPLEMIEPRWDGKLLKFSVVNSDGRSIAFEMRLTGEGSADRRHADGARRGRRRGHRAGSFHTHAGRGLPCGAGGR